MSRRKALCATTMGAVSFLMSIGASDGIAGVSRRRLEMRANPIALS